MNNTPSSPLIPRLKKFVLSNQLAEHEIRQVEKKYDIDLGLFGSTKETQQIEADYYPQIEAEYRKEARRMAPQYELFYSLEKSIRSLISETLEEAEGIEWWNSNRISTEIRTDVKKAQDSEEDAGITNRSESEIDYCTFGHLSQIIEKNWDLFGSIFRNLRAVKRVMYNLNNLRNPIAHCALLAEDEVLRLHLSMRDWFRQME
ncbi:MAG TPA: Swt1 family HEPN domain-containing protein [Patescibacteria group bacterium]|nr:Swt1 family HEPN domain-containing protein [Patescibacteria group bacterium]